MKLGVCSFSAQRIPGGKKRKSDAGRVQSCVEATRVHSSVGWLKKTFSMFPSSTKWWMSDIFLLDSNPVKVWGINKEYVGSWQPQGIRPTKSPYVDELPRGLPWQGWILHSQPGVPGRRKGPPYAWPPTDALRWRSPMFHRSGCGQAQPFPAVLGEVLGF